MKLRVNTNALFHIIKGRIRVNNDIITTWLWWKRTRSAPLLFEPLWRAAKEREGKGGAQLSSNKSESGQLLSSQSHHHRSGTCRVSNGGEVPKPPHHRVLRHFPFIWGHIKFIVVLFLFRWKRDIWKAPRPCLYLAGGAHTCPHSRPFPEQTRPLHCAGNLHDNARAEK